MVPIVPDMVKNLHRQWMAYEGFSFAFEPYMQVGLLDHIDDEATKEGMKAIDPFSFREQLSTIPKFTVLSSGDEFMMMDWSNIWDKDIDLYGSYGEQHLAIAPNADHVLVTNVRAVLSNSVTFSRSIANG